MTAQKQQQPPCIPFSLMDKASNCLRWTHCSRHCISVTGSSLLGSNLEGKAVGKSPLATLMSRRQMRVS